MSTDEVDSTADSNPHLRDGSVLSEFIENMGLHYEVYGIPRIGGRILGLLMVSANPMTSEEISETLQVSRSSISTNLRTLLMTGLVEKVSLPGDRCDYFVFAEEAWDRLLEMRLEGISPLRDLAEESMEGLEDGHPARQRMEEMLAWVELVEKAYQRLTRQWQSHREAPV